MSEARPGTTPHVFTAAVTWGGPGASPTTEIRRFSRVSTASAGADVPPLRVSAARTFFGDRDAWNPETLFLSALAQCHLLSFLRQAAIAGHEVLDATVEVTGTLGVSPDGSGAFTGAGLTPSSTFAGEVDDAGLAALHAAAHQQCFIANSLNFPVTVAPDTRGALRP